MRPTTPEQRWQRFSALYVEGGWFDFEDRPKTLKAMRRACEQIPENVWDEMLNVLVFAPSPEVEGHALPWASSEDDGFFIYLAPQLESESMSQDYVDYVVAHEFAHIVLNHYDPENPVTRRTPEQTSTIQFHEDSPMEKEADSLVKSWGFHRPEAA